MGFPLINVPRYSRNALDIALLFLVCVLTACTTEQPTVDINDTRHSFGSEKADAALSDVIKKAQHGDSSAYVYLANSLCGELCLSFDKMGQKGVISEQLKRDSALGIKTNYARAYSYFLAAYIPFYREKIHDLERYLTKDQISYSKALANIWKSEKDEWDKKRKAGYETEEEKRMIYHFEDHSYIPFDHYLDDAKRGSSFTHLYIAKVYCGEVCFTPAPNANTQSRQLNAHMLKEINRHGILPDYKLAYAHFILADNFKVGYGFYRKMISPKLTEDELSEAKALARKWKKESREWNRSRGLEQPL